MSADHCHVTDSAWLVARTLLDTIWADAPGYPGHDSFQWEPGFTAMGRQRVRLREAKAEAERHAKAAHDVAAQALKDIDQMGEFSL